MSVKLEWATDKGDERIAYMARVSNPNNQDNTQTAPKLISYLIKHKHWSPFEMVNMCVEINTTRDIGRQLLRHRSFTFQEFCIHGDSLITCYQNSKTKKVSIKDLYQTYKSTPGWNGYAKVFNEVSRLFEKVKIKEVFKTGVKPTYAVTLDNGKQVISTKEHKFLTQQGFMPLADISKGDFIAVNGVAAYKDPTILENAKAISIVQGTGVQGIADSFGVSYHTIRKWLKRNGLQFTKKEVATYTQIWNKGLATSSQPMFGKLHSDRTRAKMHTSSTKGVNSNLYSTGSYRTFRMQAADWQNKYRNNLLKKFNGQCVKCGSTDKLELDHVKQVALYPNDAFNIDNLQVLCKSCHKEKSVIETNLTKQTVTWKMVESIEYFGEEETYDMEVDHISHNYIANGIVVHNSQRYADVNSLKGNLVLRECRIQDLKNRQASHKIEDATLEQNFANWQTVVWDVAMERYEKALAAGIAKEQARCLLPEGLTPTRMYMNGTLRSWIHFIDARIHPGAQKEAQDIAREVKCIIKEQFPQCYKAIWEEA